MHIRVRDHPSPESGRAVVLGEFGGLGLAVPGNLDAESVLALVLDLETHVAQIINAGHPAPILITAAGETRELAPTERGHPLGLLADSRYKCAEVQISPGDVIVLYTDGVPDAKPARVAVNTVFATTQIDAAIVACQRGLGYGQFFDYQVQDAVRSGKLKPVMQAHWPVATPIHVVYPQARLLSGNVRSFVDFVAPKLRSRIAGLRG